MLGSETAEDIAARDNIHESEVSSKDATAAVVHGSKLKVTLHIMLLLMCCLKYAVLKLFTVLTQIIF